MLFVCEHTQAFIRCHSLLRHLHIRVLAPVLLHTLVPSVDVDTGLCVVALVFTCFAFINICRRKTQHVVCLNSIGAKLELLSVTNADSELCLDS